MTAEQVSVYDAVVASAQGEDTSSESSAARQNRHLTALWDLRGVSLHPDLLAGGSIGSASNPSDARVILQRSGKLAWLLHRLDEIKPVGEKVLVFCVRKKLQEALARYFALLTNSWISMAVDFSGAASFSSSSDMTTKLSRSTSKPRTISSAGTSLPVASETRWYRILE